MLLVSGEENFIAQQQDRIAEVRIEAADQVLGIADLKEVTPEQVAELLGEERFAGATLAAQNNRDLARAIRLLHRTRHPPDQIGEVFDVARADVVTQVRKERLVHVAR